MIELKMQEVLEIAKQYGTPLYIFNQDEFIDNYHEIENTFRQVYDNYRICYSYKTNYTPAICKLVKDLGGYAEVVSDMEYHLAKMIGYDEKQIVYNGPYKGALLKGHVLNGGINNIDRIEEAHYLCAIADANKGKSIRTGIRVNFDLNKGYISRFGVDKDYLDSILQILQGHNISVNGIHFHMSRARDLESWKLRAKTIIELIDQYQLTDLEYISLGSGMYGRMDKELSCQFTNVPTYREYAEAVLKPFAEYYEGKTNKPFLFTEPGTTLISKYVDFLAKVIGIKEIRGKQFVLCNCSYHNLGETCQMKNLPIKVYQNDVGNEMLEKADFVGYTCLEQDVLYRMYTGTLARGDYVLFGNVGGYSIVDKPPFIQPNCPMIAISKGQRSLIKRAENWNDIFNTFVLDGGKEQC